MTRKSTDNRLSFDPKSWERISANLQARSISQKRIIIPVKARPFPGRTVTSFYFQCSLEKGPELSSLSWKARLPAVEGLAICALVLLNLAGWIGLLARHAKPSLSQCLILLAFSAVVLLVLLYYACMYRYCKKQFLRSIREIIG